MEDFVKVVRFGDEKEIETILHDIDEDERNKLLIERELDAITSEI